eukprot:5783922-Amphidinium_carterae.1
MEERAPLSDHTVSEACVDLLRKMLCKDCFTTTATWQDSGPERLHPTQPEIRDNVHKVLTVETMTITSSFPIT